MEHDLWKRKPFSPGQAWVDLLMRANYQDSEVKGVSPQSFHKVSTGEIVCSLRDTARDWGWSKDRVSRFFKMLENEDMIEHTGRDTFSVVKILNWKKFQGDDNAVDDTQRDTSKDSTPPPDPQKRDTHRDSDRDTHRDYQKKGKKEKKYKKSGQSAPAAPSETDRKGRFEKIRAEATALFQEDEANREKVLLWLGFLESENGKAPWLDSAVRELWNLREGIASEDGLPRDKIFQRALDAALKHRAKSTHYVATVIRDLVMKWRDGALAL
jgi:hypothetical protein